MPKLARSKITVKRTTMRKIEHMTRKTGDHSVKVGLPKGSGSYPKTGVPVINVGLWHEFGTVRMPERSFLRSAIRENRSSYAKLNRFNLKKIQADKMSVKMALGRLGAEAQSDVVAKVNFIPLVDTGLLKQSITYKVVA